MTHQNIVNRINRRSQRERENQRMRDIEEEYTSMIFVIYGISALAVIVHYLGDYL